MNKAYLFGQILGTHSFYLKDGFPVPDEYSEIAAKYFLPGGETGTAATVLCSLGARVKLDGTHIGREVAPMLRSFYDGKNVDLSSLYFDPDYDGLMDFVLISGTDRTPMGTFQQLYSAGIKRWNRPKAEDIRDADAVAIDPFFREETLEAAELCVRFGKPYVTIDCPHGTYLHRHAAINVVSKECMGTSYRGMTGDEALALLKEDTDGLTVITSGAGDILYARRGQTIRRMKPFSVPVRSTLGAGDTFKAGCIHALLKGMEDDRLVRYAAACSAVAITRFPLPLNPPTEREVAAVLDGNLPL